MTPTNPKYPREDIECPFCGKLKQSAPVICPCEVARTPEQIENDERYD